MGHLELTLLGAVLAVENGYFSEDTHLSCGELRDQLYGAK